MEAVRDRVSIERKNLSLVCSLSVKTLIDKSCHMTLDEQSAEFCNFCIILEHVFNHQFRPRVSWYGGKSMRGVWEYIKQACRTVPNNCLTNLANFEHIKTGHGKVRAWIRVSLMEKRLSEYISSATSQLQLTRRFYGDEALLLSEEADLLTKSLLGLNAIDFSFDLKGADLDAPGCTVIDYSPYLKFTQCPQSVVEDIRELRSLSVSSRDDCTSGGASGGTSGGAPEDGYTGEVEERGSPDGKGPDTPQHQAVTPVPVNGQNQVGLTCDDACSHDQYRTLIQQKGYLEELLRLRERQLHSERTERRQLETRLSGLEGEKVRDIHQMETVVIELQAQLQTLKNDYHRLQRHVIMTSQGRKSSAPRFRYSSRDQRLHSFSSDTTEASQHTNIATAEEASSLLPPSPGAEGRSSPRRPPLALVLDCDLEVPPGPTRLLSSSVESREGATTMNIEAEIHNSYDGDSDSHHEVEGSPIADLLVGQRRYYNLGGDVDRESSSEERYYARESSEEGGSAENSSDVFKKVAKKLEIENERQNEENSMVDDLEDAMNGNGGNLTLTDDNQNANLTTEMDENSNDQNSNKSIDNDNATSCENATNNERIADVVDGMLKTIT